MKPHTFILAAALATLAACDRKPATNASDEQRQADERRIAELRDLETRQAQRDSDAQAAQLEADRQKLADDQASLEEERRRLEDERAAVKGDADRLAKLRADEKRLAQRETALRDSQQKAKAAREREDDRPGRGADKKIDYFYSALDPMGEWMEVQPYGYVWQPRQAQDGGWRPYTNGTWVYTDYGWTWKGNEPFGWATYHYGRWTQVRKVGWVWVPGSEWAPAWVSWRKSPQYVGWAPLPPEAHSGTGFNGAVDSYYDIGPASYNFVPAERIGEPTYRGVVVEPQRNVTIINETTNVTRINYTTVQNNTVVYNEGPDLDQINGRSARPVQRMRLEREGRREELGGGNDMGNAVVGGVLRMLAPSIASSRGGAALPAPTRVAQRVQAPEIERGWQGEDEGARQAVKTRFRQEATTAEEQERRAPARRVQPSDRATPVAERPAMGGEQPQPTGRERPATTEDQAQPRRGDREAQPMERRPAAGEAERTTPAPAATPTQRPAATPVQVSPTSVPPRSTPRATPRTGRPSAASTPPESGEARENVTRPTRATPFATPRAIPAKTAASTPEPEEALSEKPTPEATPTRATPSPATPRAIPQRTRDENPPKLDEAKPERTRATPAGSRAAAPRATPADAAQERSPRTSPTERPDTGAPRTPGEAEPSRSKPETSEATATPRPRVAPPEGAEEAARAPAERTRTVPPLGERGNTRPVGQGRSTPAPAKTGDENAPKADSPSQTGGADAGGQNPRAQRERPMTEQPEAGTAARPEGRQNRGPRPRATPEAGSPAAQP